MYEILIQKLNASQSSALSNYVIKQNMNQELVLQTSDAGILDILDSKAINYRIIGQESLVGIFEFHQQAMGWPEKTSKGLVRITCLDDSIVVDLRLNQLDKGRYEFGINQFGDLRNSPESLGETLIKFDPFEVTLDGVIKSRKVYHRSVGRCGLGKDENLIGRSAVVSKNGSDFIIGILARSAGLEENVKRICSCSGKTIWQE